jgi:signal transduction histidine kinase
MCALFYGNDNVQNLDVFWLKATYASGALVPASLYYFAVVFTSSAPLNYKKTFWVYLPNVIFICLYFFTDLMIKGVGFNNGVKIFQYGPFYFLFDLQLLLFFTLSFKELFHSYSKAFGQRKLQLKYISFGTLISVILAGSASAFLPDLFHIFWLSKFGPFFSLPMFLFVSYAIVAHHLMDVNIVIRKTAVYSIVATIITVVYFILVYIMEGLFRGFMGYKSIPWTLGVIVVFTLIFQPLKNLVQSFVDRYFFKGSQVVLAQELEKAQEELKRAERLKAVGTLAAGMAHEIKNPLTGIKTFAEYLPHKYNDPEYRDKFQKIVINEVNKINDIVQQLLEFSKPKPLQLKQCNIHNLIDQTLAFLNNEFIKHNIKLARDYDASFPLLNLDPNQIKQVFLNLFLNSIDAMKQGGTLTISTKLLDNTAETTIKDTGIGIPKKDLEHIFDPFYSTKETGTGLGMSIVYGIIKEHKGEITVESEPGKGARFKIIFKEVLPA